MTSIAHEIVAALRRAGIGHVFGIPGGGATAELVSACSDLGVEFVLTQHETAAVIAAGVYGARRGGVGVVLAAIGPGVANLANGLASASLDRLPVIAIADRYRPGVHEVALRQQFDHLAMVRPVTKAQLTLHEDSWTTTLRRAWRLALDGRPGPVYVDFPNNYAGRPARQSLDFGPLPEPPRVAEALLAAAGERLRASRRPLILAGMGALSLPPGALAAAAAALRAPVLTSAMGKGAIAGDDAWCAGVFMGGKLEQPLIERSDLILFVGYDPVELLPRPWQVPAYSIWLDRHSNTEQTVTPDLELTGDLAPALAALARPGGASQWSPEEATGFRERVARALAVPVAGLSPNEVVTIARELVPRETVVVTDVGANKLISVELWSTPGPRQFLMSNGLATMGYCVPAAQAVKLAEPGRPVLCLCGDAGFLMRVQELVTGRRHELPIVYVIFADDQHSLITVKQRKLGKSVHGLDFPRTDYAALAQAFGLGCATVSDAAGYRKALAAALDRPERGTLIEARIDASGYAGQFDIIREL